MFLCLPPLSANFCLELNYIIKNNQCHYKLMLVSPIISWLWIPLLWDWNSTFLFFFFSFFLFLPVPPGVAFLFSEWIYWDLKVSLLWFRARNVGNLYCSWRLLHRILGEIRVDSFGLSYHLLYGGGGVRPRSHTCCKLNRKNEKEKTGRSHGQLPVFYKKGAWFHLDTATLSASDPGHGTKKSKMNLSLVKLD